MGGTDPGARHPQRDQSRLFTDWFRPLWTVCLPYLQNRLEDGKRDWRKENGRPSLFEVQRDGRVCIPATAAVGLRFIQELRRIVPCSFHGWERCCDAWQGRLL